MKISAVKPEYAVLDGSTPEIDIDNGYLYLTRESVPLYSLTYTVRFELSEDEFRRVVNAE